ncbi:MAG: metallophosphoesterase, partial [Planctomycetota bacterium]
LYGQDMLRWVLELYGSRLPIIHLGDACNMACSGEFEEFLEIMSAATKPWVMAPGNHDAYLFGNMHFNLGEWSAACRGAGEPMTKDRLVRRYLVFLQEKYGNFRAAHPDQIPLQGYWRDGSNSPKFLKSVAWEINAGKPWSSFVVQEVDLGLPNSSPPVTAVLLDTCEFKSMPTLVPTPASCNAGSSGESLPDQLEIVEDWLKDDPTGQKVTILMGHHPFATLVKETRETLSAMRKDFRIPLYVSAHTHNGEYIPRGGSEGNEGWLELNVGSIVDWPIEFRTFSIQEIRDRPHRLIFRTELFRVPGCWDWAKLMPPRSPVCQDAWEAKPEDDAYYLSYMDITSPDPKATQEKLMDSLLHTYKKFLSDVPSAENNQIWIEGCSSDEQILKEIDRALSSYGLKEKIVLMRRLDQFDRKRIPANILTRRDYRLRQAVWSSKYDKLERRQPIPSDSYISFPRR